MTINNEQKFKYFHSVAGCIYKETSSYHHDAVLRGADGTSYKCAKISLAASSEYLCHLMEDVDSVDEDTLLILPDTSKTDLESLVNILTCVPGQRESGLRLQPFRHLRLNFRGTCDLESETCSAPAKFRDERAELLELNVDQANSAPRSVQSRGNQESSRSTSNHIPADNDADAEVRLDSLESAVNPVDLSHVVRHSQRRHKRHIISKPPPPNITRIDCHMCGAGLAGREDLILHLKTRHQATPFKCSRCRKSFADGRELEEHQAIHDLVSVNDFSCDQCSKNYSSLVLLNQHKKDKHTNLKFTCHLTPCLAVFSAQRYLKEHIKKKHSDASKPTCPICYKVFAGKQELKTHTTIHTGERPYKCDICSKSFRTKSVLTLHLKMHNNVKDVVCDECGQTFIQKSDLNNHMRMHTGSRPYKCTECDKAFARRDYLKKHMRFHARLKSNLLEASPTATRKQHGSAKHDQDVILGELRLENIVCGEQVEEAADVMNHVVRIMPAADLKYDFVQPEDLDSEQPALQQVLVSEGTEDVVMQDRNLVIMEPKNEDGIVGHQGHLVEHQGRLAEHQGLLVEHPDQHEEHRGQIDGHQDQLVQHPDQLMEHQDHRVEHQDQLMGHQDQLLEHQGHHQLIISEINADNSQL